jgi:type II secretory pathway pseudopilin PulG
MVSNNYKKVGGFSLVEVLVVSTIMLIVFGGLLISFKYSLELISHSRAKLTALTVANDTMEYVRSLSYTSVGTVSGIPSGSLPQVSTTTLNGILFTKSVLIEYVDDDADGLGLSDTNSITTDYKRVKIAISWTIKNDTQEVFLVSNIIPRSIETSVGGGTLRVNVFDAAVTPLPGATVRLVNNTVLPHIDITRTTDSSGIALFGGAPAGPDYEITVTGSGYSVDKTYMATTSLPNPSTQPVAVSEADISTMNFFIDRTSTLKIEVLSDKTEGKYTDTFVDLSQTATSSGVAISGGNLQLFGTPGAYVAAGTAYSNQISPSPLADWDYLSGYTSTPAGTSVRIQLFTGTSTYSLIPDTDLPGNSTGFSGEVVDISMLSTVTYSSLVVGVTLNSGANTLTPTLNSLAVGYTESKSALAGSQLSIRGGKVIGTDSDTMPIYKNSFIKTTSATGTISLPDTEWDIYRASAVGYDISSLCPVDALDMQPNTNINAEMILRPDTTNTLRVVVTKSGDPVPGAVVSLSRPGFLDVKSVGACGQVFFSGLNSSTEYSIQVVADGYSDITVTDINISGDIVQDIEL